MKYRDLINTALTLREKLYDFKKQIARKQYPDPNDLLQVSVLLDKLTKGLSLNSSSLPKGQFSASKAVGHQLFKSFVFKLATGTFDTKELDLAIENVDGLLKTLNPSFIFLLTAPFDEDARTGDGQYAESLVEGFKRHGNGTQCIWLKEKLGHYKVVAPEGLEPIPEKTIPSVYVLQPVANGQTVISGYRYSSEDYFETARLRIGRNLTVRTPQIILNAQRNLKVFAYQDVNETISFIAKTDVEQRIAILTHRRGIANTRIDEAQIRLTSLKERIDPLLATLSAFKSDIFALDLSKLSERLIGLRTFLSQHNELGSIDNAPEIIGALWFIHSLDKIIKPLKLSESQANKAVATIATEIAQIDSAIALMRRLREQFEDGSYNEDKLTAIADELSGVRASTYDFSTNNVEARAAQRPSTSRIFYKVLAIANADPDRKAIIQQLIKTMSSISKERTCSIDIHIRPPDTGAFIAPEDIIIFKQSGLFVNVTIHEYKQNYTRRHLQKMIHELLRLADTVQFFNDKDKKNAVKASISGDLDYQRRALGYWPIVKYDLASKVGLTVASQILSGQPMEPINVLAKEPNILSFGTIRPGKGFEEAFAIAKELKNRAQHGHQIFSHVLIAGDPQYTELMQELFEERYGAQLVQSYQVDFPTAAIGHDSRLKRDYWRKAKIDLELLVKENAIPLRNPYLELHPWCEPQELQKLKDRSKYVCRMDDMGMRNNGSAIISVLDVGIIYTKWGTVTDKEYQPGGIYGNAVDLGQKYGIHKDKRSFNPKPQERIENDYKRRGEAREPIADILQSILARESDQLAHADDIEQSRNYKTVVAAQSLLATKFTLKNSVQFLKAAFIRAQKSIKPVQVVDTYEDVDLDEEIPILDEVDIFEGTQELGGYAQDMMFFGNRSQRQLFLEEEQSSQLSFNFAMDPSMKQKDQWMNAKQYIDKLIQIYRLTLGSPYLELYLRAEYRQPPRIITSSILVHLALIGGQKQNGSIVIRLSAASDDDELNERDDQLEKFDMFDGIAELGEAAMQAAHVDREAQRDFALSVLALLHENDETIDLDNGPTLLQVI